MTMTKLEVKHEKNEATILFVDKSAHKRFKKIALDLDLTMIELHRRISKVSTAKIRTLLE
jgi:hypothetical protein